MYRFQEADHTSVEESLIFQEYSLKAASSR